MEPLPKEPFFPNVDANASRFEDLNSQKSKHSNSSESSSEEAPSLQPTKKGLWHKSLGLHAEKELRKIEVLDPRPLSNSQLFFYRLISAIKKIFTKGPLRIFSYIHNQTLLVAEHRGSHQAGSMNFIQKKLFINLLKKEIKCLGKEDNADPDLLNRYQSILGELSSLQTSENIYFKNKTKVARSYVKKISELKVGECLWLDVSSKHGRHAMKAMIKKTSEADFQFYFANTGSGVEENPDFHPVIHILGKEKHQVVARWDNLTLDHLSEDFFKDLIKAQFKKPSNSPSENDLKGIENLEAIQQIYSVLKQLPNKAVIPYEKDSPYWHRKQLGVSCTPSSYWAIFRVRDHAICKMQKTNSIFYSLRKVSTKILTGKKTSTFYITHGQELINKIQKRRRAIGLGELWSLMDLSRRINDQGIDESVLIKPSNSQSIDLTQNPAEIEMKQAFFSKQDAGDNFEIQSHLQEIEGTPRLELLYDQEGKLLPNLETLGYLLYHELAQGNTDLQKEYLEEIVKYIRKKQPSDLMKRSEKNTLQIVAQLFVDMGLQLYQFDPSRLGLVKANTMFALSILMIRVLKTYRKHDKELVESLDEKIRDNFPEIKQASINLDAVSYDISWGDNLVAIMRELAEQDTLECNQQFEDFTALPLHKNFKVDASNFFGDKIEYTIRKQSDDLAQITLKGCGEEKIWENFPLQKILNAPKGERTFFDSIWHTKTEKPQQPGLRHLPIYKFLAEKTSP